MVPQMSGCQEREGSSVNSVCVLPPSPLPTALETAAVPPPPPPRCTPPLMESVGYSSALASLSSATASRYSAAYSLTFWLEILTSRSNWSSSGSLYIAHHTPRSLSSCGVLGFQAGASAGNSL